MRGRTRLGQVSMKIHDLITTTNELAALCARWANAPFIAVDTEFMRENTYWPDLCLIQVADHNEAAAIDPKAPGLDLTPLLDLLTENKDVLKVVHAGGQDIEIVCNLTGKTPHPMFDTQIAAMALGQGEQVGYSNLVDSWLGIPLDKGVCGASASQRRTLVVAEALGFSGTPSFVVGDQLVPGFVEKAQLSEIVASVRASE